MLDPDAVATLSRCNDEAELAQRFTQAWTRFEAQQKMTGQGLFGERCHHSHQLLEFAPQGEWWATLALLGQDDLPTVEYLQYEP
jgi:phosphopantetheinyl transferase